MRKIKIGSLQQKASKPMVQFVFGCIIIITGILYIDVKSEMLGRQLTSVIKYGSPVDTIE
jgi:hypothetical protein